MNEKVNKVCDVILKILGIMQILAQAVKSVFPVEVPQNVSAQNQQAVSNFFKGGIEQ